MTEQTRRKPWLWCEVVCIGCAESGHGTHVRADLGALDDLAAVVAGAISEGWIVTDDGEWLCESCQTKQKVGP